MEGLKYEQITKEMLYSINEIKEIFRVGAVFTTIKKTPLKGTENIFLKDVAVLFPFPLKQKIGTVIYGLLLPVKEGIVSAPIFIGKGLVPYVSANEINLCSDLQLRQMREHFMRRCGEFGQMIDDWKVILNGDRNISRNMMGRLCARGNKICVTASGNRYCIGTVDAHGNKRCRLSAETWANEDDAAAACITGKFEIRDSGETEFCNDGKGCI